MHSQITYRSLVPEDIDELYALHSSIYRQIGTDDFFATDPREFFERLIGLEGRTFGAFSDRQMVGYANMRFPDLSGENLGRDLDLQPPELIQVAHLESSGVMPQFRGRGIHSALSDIRIKEAIRLGYCILMSTVSPHNVPSIVAKTSNDIPGVAIRKKYGGHNRLIFLRNYANPINFPRPTSAILADDYSSLQSVLSAGFWVVGAEQNKEGEVTLLLGKDSPGV